MNKNKNELTVEEVKLVEKLRQMGTPPKDEEAESLARVKARLEKAVEAEKKRGTR